MSLERSAWLAVVFALCSACAREPESARALPGEAPSKVAAADDSSVEALEIPSDAPLVVFLGDSITAGLHLDAGEAFPAVAQRELARAGHPFRLVNAGVSGDTSAGGLRRIDWILKQKPDVLVIELGGNDGLRGQELSAIEDNLRKIIEKSKASGARVLLLGMRLPSSYGSAYGDAFVELYERLAKEQQVALVPFFMNGVGGMPDLNLEDGMHPNANGHRRLAQNLHDELHALLEPR